MGIAVIPFSKSHVAYLIDSHTEPGMFETLSQARGYFEAIEASGTAFSGFVNGVFIGCAGWSVTPWKTVAEVWSWIVPEGRRHPLAVHKLVARGLRGVENDSCIKRIQCAVRVGNAAGERWVKALGFEAEGIMRNWGLHQEDYYMMAKVRA
jgi:RimJ/RimL family protein N-acetyltransferase